LAGRYDIEGFSSNLVNPYLSESMILDSDFGSVFTTSSGIIFFLSYFFPTLALKFFGGVGKVLKKIGDAISTLGKSAYYRYTVILSKIDQCGPKCQVTESDLNTIFAKRAISTLGASGNVKYAKKVQCLIDCFFTNLVDLIVMNMKGHLICLIYTKNMKHYLDMNPKDLINLFRMPTLSAEDPCYIYLEVSHKLLMMLEEMMSFAYKNFPQKKTMIIDLLYQEVLKIKQELANKQSSFKPQQNKN
jgi:hypothetical protein